MGFFASHPEVGGKPYPITLSGPIEEDQNYTLAVVNGVKVAAGKPMFYLNASGTKYYLLHGGEFYNESDLMEEAQRLGLQDWAIPSTRAGINFTVTGLTWSYSYQCWKQGAHKLSTLKLNLVSVDTMEKG